MGFLSEKGVIFPQLGWKTIGNADCALIDFGFRSRVVSKPVEGDLEDPVEQEGWVEEHVSVQVRVD